MKLKSVDVTTTIPNQEILPTIGEYKYSARHLTLSVSQDTNIYLNGSSEPVLIKSRYGLTLPDNVFIITSIKVEKASTEVYCVFAY